MRIKIVGDGTPLGTHVFNAETGEPIDGVNYIVYEQDVVGPARVLLGLELDSIDVTVDNVDLVKNDPADMIDVVAKGAVVPVPELTNA